MAYVHRRDGILPASKWRLDISSSSAAESITEFTEHTLNSMQDFSGVYIPNKYYRILRDVITATEPSEENALVEEEDSEAAVVKKPCPFASVRFKVSSLADASFSSPLHKLTRIVFHKLTQTTSFL